MTCEDAALYSCPHDPTLSIPPGAGLLPLAKGGGEGFFYNDSLPMPDAWRYLQFTLCAMLYAVFEFPLLLSP